MTGEELFNYWKIAEDNDKGLEFIQALSPEELEKMMEYSVQLLKDQLAKIGIIIK